MVFHMPDYRSPYLAVADPRLAMRGEGAPRSTVFGALGVGGGAKGFVGAGVKSLGGLVDDTKSKHGGKKDDVIKAKDEFPTEHGYLRPKSHTPLPALHYGQVLYAGKFFGHKGERLA
jgi:hypothetical protein